MRAICGRHVGAQRDDLTALRLDEAQHFIRLQCPQAALEHFGVLEHGQGHDLVTVKLEAARDAARELTLAARNGRQQITHARGQRMLERAGPLCQVG